jgi:gamma-glutamyltranspeptidase/glutathione hydrolase
VTHFRGLGLDLIPEDGPLSIQAPGLVAGFEAIRERWATQPRAALLEPAIALARDGVEVSARLAGFLAENEAKLAVTPAWLATFSIDGRLACAGERLVQERLARTLTRIASEGAAGFYRGPVAADIAATVRDAGGLLSAADLAMVRAELDEPLCVSFRGLAVATQPPVSQGVVLLRACKLLAASQAPNAARQDPPAYWVAAARAFDQAFQERLTLVGDGAQARRRARAMLDGAVAPAWGKPWAREGRDTTTIVAVDRHGATVSLILSVFADLGSGVVARESGVLLNNRLSGFFLDDAHPNGLAPGRRTISTLHSLIATDPSGAIIAGGSPGGDHQPQVNLQVLARLVDMGQPLADAAGEPRWALVPGTIPADLARRPRPEILAENGLDLSVLDAFASAGIAVAPDRRTIGSAKFVRRDPTSSLLEAVADDRRDGAVTAS